VGVEAASEPRALRQLDIRFAQGHGVLDLRLTALRHLVNQRDEAASGEQFSDNPLRYLGSAIMLLFTIATGVVMVVVGGILAVALRRGDRTAAIAVALCSPSWLRRRGGASMPFFVEPRWADGSDQ
jgi:uncharacterized protein YjeT (DUF2065 family)